MKSLRRFAFAVLLAFVMMPRSHGAWVLPLKLSEDSRYLVDQRNTPFPILGRTAWCVISQPESGYGKFLENTLAHGHNAIEVSALCHWPMGNHPPFNGEREQPFLRRLNGEAWDGKLEFRDIRTEGPDLLTPNENYWRYLDTFLARCEREGVVVFLFPAYLGYDFKEQGWGQELIANGPEKTEAYGAWFATRYRQRKNLIWMLLGDFGKFNAIQRTAEAALIRGLKSVPGQQSILYTAESFSGENANENADFGHEMTINGCYTWDTNRPVAMVTRRGYAHQPVMPAFLLEEPYDEEGPDGNNYNRNATQPVRRFQWWGWLGTVGGYVSGNGYIWPFIDPLWQQHLNTQTALDMAWLNTFIKSIPWWTLVPSGLNGMKALIVDSENKDTAPGFVAASASKDGSLLIAYVPPAHVGPIAVDLSGLKPRRTARWFDPTSGQYRTISGSLKGAGVHEFTPPGPNSRQEADWVLRIDAK